MTVFKIEQGAQETIQLPLSIDPTALQSFVVNIYQDGELRIFIPMSRCTIAGNDITFTLTEAETLSLSPNRCGIDLRGYLGNGNTFLMREIPCEVIRSKYTEPLS